MLQLLKFSIFWSFCLVSEDIAWAATGNATASTNVIAPLTITNVSDLDFGNGGPGDSALAVPPGSAENSSNGSFDVTGQPSTSYTIILPANGAVTLSIGGGPTQNIGVNNFTSYPLAGANGLLNASGYQLLLIGATRDAIRADQVAGSYTATYTVEVAY